MATRTVSNILGIAAGIMFLLVGFKSTFVDA